MNDSADLARSDGEVAQSLGNKLAAYADGLPSDERALLQYMLLTALPPHERLRFIDDGEILSEEERALMASLAAPR